MKAYGFKAGARVPGIAPQVVGEALEAVRIKSGGLTAEAVVNAVRARSHPLHSFVWGESEAEAATAWRLQRAAYLIRSIELIRVETPTRVRAFVPLFVAPLTPLERRAPRANVDPARIFVPILDAMKNPLQREALLARARAELRAWRERYRDFQELAAVFAAIDKT